MKLWGMGSRVWALGLCLLSLATAHATDLTTGYSFSSGEQNVTHTKLNNAVNNAVINTSFFTDKAATTSPADTDLALLYTTSGFRKVSLLNLIYGQTTLITGRTEDTAPASDDLVLTYDTSATALKKATLANLVFENAGLINARTNWNTPAGDNFFLGYDGAWNKVARSNLWYQFWNYRTSDFTNLATHTYPTNLDALVLWDSVSGTNRQIPLINLFSNAAPAVTLQPTNVLTLVNGTNLATASLNTFSNYWRTNVVVPLLPTNFASSETALSAGLMLNVAHGLPGTPQQVRWVLKCTTADDGHAIGDEVGIDAFVTGNDNDQAFQGGANTTNVFLIMNSAGTLRGKNKATGGEDDHTPGSWRAKGYATYFFTP